VFVIFVGFVGIPVVGSWNLDPEKPGTREDPLVSSFWFLVMPLWIPNGSCRHEPDYQDVTVSNLVDEPSFDLIADALKVNY